MNMIEQLGFIGIHELNNVFITELTALDEDLHVNGLPRDPKMFIEFVDGIRLKLMKRAQTNLQAYLQKNPEVKKDIKHEKEAVDNQAKRKDYQERIKANRARALLGE